jgi:hypothetical protein
MGDITPMKRIDLSSIDLRWILGSSVASYSYFEPDFWVLSLSGGGSISTQSVWRLLMSDGMAVSSADHGHPFGLPAPVDAAARALLVTSTSVIVEAHVDPRAPDLLAQFENGAVLQVLATSIGYECWQVCEPSGACTVVDGSRNASTWTEARRG